MPFFRKIEEQFEARPTPPAGRSGDARCKIERTRFGDGVQELEVKAKGLDLPDGERVELVVDGEVLLEIEVERGRAKVEFDTDSGRHVPEVSAGQTVQIRHGGETLLEGDFYLD